MAKSLPILVSGIQPSGRLHIGNYLGALKNFVELQNSGKYDCYFFIADLHSLTEEFDPKEKSKQILELAADFLAAGLDPERSVLFLQSHIPAHTELGWILETIAPIGELRRMTQYKEKSESEKESSNAGLLTYPALMAADILLYDARFVPVGDDQDQHLELTRMLARKFNKRFGETFVEPKGLHTNTPRVMSLADPAKKMSKSQPESCLFLGDEPDVVRSKVKRAVTDSGSEISYDRAKKPGVSNLLEIYAAFSDVDIPALEKQFKGKSYLNLKSGVAELIVDSLSDYRKRKKALLTKPNDLAAALATGSKKASLRADKKIAEVKRKVGIAI